jgi:D-alanine-D-alanine ligase-like ATP-grasp enzyme
MIDVKSVSAQLLVQAARQQGLQVKILSKRNNFFSVSDQQTTHYFQATAMPVNSQTGARIANNKFLTKKVLREHGLPVPKSWTVQKASEIRQLVKKFQPFPCVLKPAEGAHGNQVFTDIEDEEDLDRALTEIFHGTAPRDVILEEYIHGRDLRVFVVGETVPAVLERIPAHVIGDGEKNIRQLVKVFNQHPLVGEKYEKPMCKIHLRKEEKRILKKQGLSVNSVPTEGQQVWLRQNANISTGGIGKDVTETIPTYIKQMAIASCQAIGLTIAGLDILYDEQHDRAVVLEINDTAGIDIHHFPVQGQPRNVAQAIMKYLFPKVTLPETQGATDQMSSFSRPNFLRIH